MRVANFGPMTFCFDKMKALLEIPIRIFGSCGEGIDGSGICIISLTTI